MLSDFNYLRNNKKPMSLSLKKAQKYLQDTMEVNRGGKRRLRQRPGFYEDQDHLEGKQEGYAYAGFEPGAVQQRPRMRPPSIKIL
jgi:hypothetical protein